MRSCHDGSGCNDCASCFGRPSRNSSRMRSRRSSMALIGRSLCHRWWQAWGSWNRGRVRRRRHWSLRRGGRDIPPARGSCERHACTRRGGRKRNGGGLGGRGRRRSSGSVSFQLRQTACPNLLRCERRCVFGLLFRRLRRPIAADAYGRCKGGESITEPGHWPMCQLVFRIEQNTRVTRVLHQRQIVSARRAKLVQNEYLKHLHR